MTAVKSVALISHPKHAEAIQHWVDSNDANFCDYIRDIHELSKVIEQRRHMLAFVSWEAQVPDLSSDRIQEIKYLLDPDTYLIVFSNSNAEDDIVRALQAGADRFIHSEASLRISLALINAAIRRMDPSNNVLEFHPYSMNRMTREVNISGERIQLTPGEFRIALHLFQNNGRILTRTSLLRDIWGLPELQYNRRVDTKMSHVRRKMMLDGSHGWALTFPRGKGYKLEKLTRDPDSVEPPSETDARSQGASSPDAARQGINPDSKPGDSVSIGTTVNRCSTSGHQLRRPQHNTSQTTRASSRGS